MLSCLTAYGLSEENVVKLLLSSNVDKKLKFNQDKLFMLINWHKSWLVGWFNRANCSRAVNLFRPLYVLRLQQKVLQ